MWVAHVVNDQQAYTIGRYFVVGVGRNVVPIFVVRAPAWRPPRPPSVERAVCTRVDFLQVVHARVRNRDLPRGDGRPNAYRCGPHIGWMYWNA